MAAALLGRCHAGSDAPLCAVKRRLTLQFPREAVHQPITYRLAVDYDVASRIIRAQVAPNQRGTLVVELSGDIDELDAAQEWLMGLGLTISSAAGEIAIDPGALRRLRHLLKRLSQWRLELQHTRLATAV